LWAGALAGAGPDFATQVQPLLRLHCVKCHGPVKHEAELSLASAQAVRNGGENGPVVVPGQPAESLLWQRVVAGEMPPEERLPAAARELLREWIAAGAAGLPAEASGEPAGAEHRAFRALSAVPLPRVRSGGEVRTAVDLFIQAELERRGKSPAPEAPRAVLIRRVAFDLTGLPPTPEEVRAFAGDRRPDAYEQMVERYLASPRYGERWGKYWLDAAGYADSNGYFDADTDRPLAYRYRDYVVRAFNEDRPWDQMVREQLAGDELSGWRPGSEATPAQVEMLVATHYLRNGPDGSGSSDGNPDEVRVDRFAALEASMQIVASSLLGLTIQCAKCHDHKFEPVTQRDYYQFQAVLAPAFNLERWLTPDQRVVSAPLAGELAAWEARRREHRARAAEVRAEWQAWLAARQPAGETLFIDDFSAPSLAGQWSATAPGDDAPGGAAPVQVDSDASPGAILREGRLQVVETQSLGDRWLSTKAAFDWTPEQVGEWIQVTFELVADRVGEQGRAERIGYFIALHDFNDSGGRPGGNLLIDGNPAGGATVHVDYPGADARDAGQLGKTGYRPGATYGVRVTNRGGGRYELGHLVDGIPEEAALQLTADDLPDGGFGFEYCCRRSFVVDAVRVMRGRGEPGAEAAAALREEYARQRKQYEEELARWEQEPPQPAQIAWLSDVSPEAPAVHLLERGSYQAAGERVEPAPLAVLRDPGETLAPQPKAAGQATTGRRRAWAEWVTRPGSRPAALVARVHANRIWQHHFGTGLVATPANLGYSGAEPTHPELLEYLAHRLVAEGWRAKALHRLLVGSAVYRQASRPAAAAGGSGAHAGWAPRRLEAEAVRDAMLAVSGELDGALGGPYTPTRRQDGEVVVDEASPGARRRSLYLQQRRSQVTSLLQLFDAPGIVVQCAVRPRSTTPLQSLGLLNSSFVVERARRLAARVTRETGARRDQVARAVELAYARPATEDEIALGLAFVERQAGHYGGASAEVRPELADFCQMLLASNEFLYLE
jgi:hypothetical protein